jgi:sec-independent protein translocase protein TatA
MFGPFSGWEILIILFVVLLIFGPGRLGELGKSLGEGIRNFKKAVSGEEELQKTTSAQTPVQNQPAAPQQSQQNTQNVQPSQEQPKENK